MEHEGAGHQRPALVSINRNTKEISIPDPNFELKRDARGNSIGTRPSIVLRQFDFTIQFAWKPSPLGKRLEAREQKDKPAATPALAEGATPGAR